jgi:threonine aldolase
MRQAGLLAAAGLYALRNNLARLAEDHRRARALAEGLRGIPWLSVQAPETNIVMVDLVGEAASPAALLAALEERGVRLAQFGARRLRAVTHLDVDDGGIERAITAFRQVAP